MTERTRFCVLFTGTEEGQPVKTRLLYNDSSKQDLLLIWKQIYEVEASEDAELIISENCIYKLDDEDDIVAFLAQAEDQYKLLPSQPLRVTLGNSRRYFSNRSPSPTASKETTTPPPVSSAGIPKPVGIITPKSIAATDLSFRRPDVNSNNNNRHHSGEDVMTISNSVENSPIYHQQSHKESRSDTVPAWSPANSLMMLYNRYRGHEQMKSEIGKSTSNPATPSYKTVGGVIDSITSASALAKSPNLPTLDKGYEDQYSRSENLQPAYENPYVAYTKHLANALARPPVPHPTDLSKNKDTRNLLPETSTGLQKQGFNLSAYSAFMNNLQDQRMIQSNPSASYILQTIFNNHIKGNNQTSDQQQNDQHRLGASFLDQKPPLNAALMNQQNLLKSPNHTTPTHPFQATRPSSLLSSLAHYNSNSLLSYMNGGAAHALHNGTNVDDGRNDFSSKKTHKKRKRNGLLNDDSKATDSSKRMRSSVSQSNIEYHYQRALDYSQMAEEDQKLQNSAHRSHWKHLLFVAKISPRFLERFKHAKYDEWSSEARDIFAMCQPDKYMWSFLTLSKQGDMLCKRITGRIDALLSKSLEERPEWCPDDETLHRAQTRARERLSQLQRILYSRTMNQEAKAAEKANELEKLSMQEKNLALVTAYHQRQQEFIQNHQAMVKQAANYHQQLQHQQQQENQRPPAVFQATQSARCSSLTSSPVSMASPAFEDNNSAGSGCSESPTPSREDGNNEGNLVIAEDKESTSSPEVAEDIAIRNISPMPFVPNDKIGLSSPQKWQMKLEQVADV